MSFIRQYSRLFRVFVVDIDTGESLNSFSFLPTHLCTTKMDNHHLVYRQRSGGLDVYYQSNPQVEEAVLGIINTSTGFDFSFFQYDVSFTKNYLPDITVQDHPQFQFDNLSTVGDVEIAESTTLSHGEFVAEEDATKIFNEIFYEHVDISDGSSKVIIRDRFDANETIAEFPIESPAVNGISQIKIDMSEQNIGNYILTTDGTDTEEKKIYIDQDLVRQSPYGIVNIYVDKPQDEMPENGAEFIIGFKHR